MFAACRPYAARFGPALLLLAAGLFGASPAWALIEGGEGNEPIRDPGWPRGAADAFNHPTRVAFWVGPPLGGGQWHGEYRGTAVELNVVLAQFAKIEAKNKRLVVRDGVGRSFWLNPNRGKALKEAAQIDWKFTVWEPASWERQRKLPPDLSAAAGAEAEHGPPVELEIYEGNLKWKDVEIPKGLALIDERLAAHGFMPSEGVVLEGKVVDLETQKPLAATMRLERVEPRPEGGYRYTGVGAFKTDAEGRWVSRRTPAGWLRLVIEAEGYAPRVAAYVQLEEEPCWQEHNTALARGASVSGRVTDDQGKPLEGVEVRLANVAAKNGGGYASPADYQAKTDPLGNFLIESAPVGTASVWVHKPGYCRPGLGAPISLPAKDVSLTMLPAARLEVVVDFSGAEPPAAYIVNIAPEGGSVVGSWGGSGQINAKNRISFENVPPGRYVLFGRPNPGGQTQESPRVTVDLKGGKTTELMLPARP